jgi:hypothetical protein
LSHASNAQGQPIPAITLPSNFALGHSLIDQDLRVGKKFSWREKIGLDVFAERFNCLNIANLGGYSGDLAQPSSFGQATSRIFQVFGSGGPRAFQLGSRLSF